MLDGTSRPSRRVPRRAPNTSHTPGPRMLGLSPETTRVTRRPKTAMHGLDPASQNRDVGQGGEDETKKNSRFWDRSLQSRGPRRRGKLYTRLLRYNSAPMLQEIEYENIAQERDM